MKRRLNKKRGRKIVAVSGGFDPVHIGHTRMFDEAKKLGNYLIVIMNNDNWLKKKKGFVFMEQKERAEILKAFKAVDEVIFTSHEKDTDDMSVCHSLRKIHPHIFANGGDRVVDNVPEVALCRELGIDMVFNVGKGGKIQSSSWLVNNLNKKAKNLLLDSKKSKNR